MSPLSLYVWVVNVLLLDPFFFPNEVLGLQMRQYFGRGGVKTYTECDTRELIHDGSVVQWSPYSLKRPFHLVDREMPQHRHNFFIGICACYFTLRRGNRFIVEPYSLCCTLLASLVSARMSQAL